MRIPINVNRIIQTQKKLTEKWHKNIEHKEKSYKEIYNLVALLHYYNYSIWHLEDEARDPTASVNRIAEIKKILNTNNQFRNDIIEKIDCCVEDYVVKLDVKVKENAIYYTETIGSVIDRLSILALKIYHMYIESLRPKTDTVHMKECSQKLIVLKEQKNYLNKALTYLVKEVFEGNIKQFVYRQYKMYNDPKLNPYIYKNTKKTTKRFKR